MTTDIRPERSADGRKATLNVFVSYAREDLHFTDQIVAALTAFGFTTTIDRKGIHGAENWRRRLGQLILESDVVVFVLSPASVQSEMCRWEVEEAVRRGKRVVPVLAAPLSDAEPDGHLRDLNYIYFYPEPASPGSGFGTGVGSLIAALSVNVEWTREHTRVGELAERWQRDGRSADLLLRGSELARSKQWRDGRPSNAPELTTLQREFLQASEDAEKARLDAEREQIEERKRALEQAEEANRQRQLALQKLGRRTRIGVAGMSVLAVVLIVSAWFAAQQKAALQQATEQLATQQRRIEQARDQLEGATLRLREGMKLKIADTDHVVSTTEKWYRIATDYKLAIGTYRAPMLGSAAADIGTGFLVQGGVLRPEWAGRVLFITASHVIRSGRSDEEPNLARAVIVFPGIRGAQPVKPAEVLFESGLDELDVAVLGLAGPPPRHAVPVDLASAIEAKNALGGIAVLHWTARDGFSIGFGHGLPRPNFEGLPDNRMFYTHVTGAGASGAPVFDASSGRVVCLHVGGMPRPPRPVGFCTSMSSILAAVGARAAG